MRFLLGWWCCSMLMWMSCPAQVSLSSKPRRVVNRLVWVGWSGSWGKGGGREGGGVKVKCLAASLIELTESKTVVFQVWEFFRDKTCSL